MHWLAVLLLSITMVFYLLIGGAVFMALEKSHEDEIAATQTKMVAKFLSDNTCLTSANLTTFVHAVIAAYDDGVLTTPGFKSESNWDFGASIFFSSTIVTTIGYGNIAPSTRGGRIFFTFYALFGIPLTVVLLAGLGEKMSQPYAKLDQKQLIKKHAKIDRIAKIILFSCFCYAIFSLVPAAIFMYVENWTYLEAWYYTMVTLTTVGFGDFVPGQRKSEHRTVYKLVVFVWIFLGLAWLSLVLRLIGNFVQEYTNKVDKELQEENTSVENLGPDDKNAANVTNSSTNIQVT